MTVTKKQIVSWLERSIEVFSAQQDLLTSLDREIGDADHGLNMNRGFKKVNEKLPSISDKDIGTILKTTGITLLSSIGGASGPLYGTFFIRCASLVMAKEELSLRDLTEMLQGGIDGIKDRGKAEIGDKTMIDTFSGILSSLKLNQGKRVVEAINLAAEAGEVATKSTIPMIAKKGRASYLGERSIGHQDPGATSASLLFNCLRDAVK
ncbi:dihydroxyacetone kinase subunit DhaL [Agarivorans sp. TSD2052]|uniref:dihydroxyacetone kinase subunit DhaL n=1 Tax=Agarivorans sp. TSD2052 TaxID=2937286 RepID=UPI00200E44E7|nr:dihydroxyacetone kinase subunit DhaL [Agarivorans sp. TSD2052]UPW18073.1 dihydroxyacetone kinase subunit DhaL [Agarivorans sp. TSD2052]